MHRSVWIAIACLLSGGCDGDADSVAAPPPPDDARVPELAAAWTTAAPPEPWLVVGDDGVSMGDGPAIVTLEDRRVRAADRVHDGFLVRPLHERLTATPAAAGPLGVAVDPDIPFRTVSAVMFTLGRAERTELVFLVRSAGAVAALPLVVGRARDPGSRAVSSVSIESSRRRTPSSWAPTPTSLFAMSPARWRPRAAPRRARSSRAS